MENNKAINNSEKYERKKSNCHRVSKFSCMTESESEFDTAKMEASEANKPKFVLEKNVFFGSVYRLASLIRAAASFIYFIFRFVCLSCARLARAR